MIALCPTENARQWIEDVMHSGKLSEGQLAEHESSWAPSRAPCSATLRKVLPRSGFSCISPAPGARPSGFRNAALPGPRSSMEVASQWYAVTGATGKPSSASSMAGCSTCRQRCLSVS